MSRRRTTVAEKTFENPNWQPLEDLVGPSECGEFMWMWRESGIEFYKHIWTRRYLLLDSEGRCYMRGPDGFQQTDVQAELKRVKE